MQSRAPRGRGTALRCTRYQGCCAPEATGLWTPVRWLYRNAAKQVRSQKPSYAVPAGLRALELLLAPATCCVLLPIFPTSPVFTQHAKKRTAEPEAWVLSF